MWALTGALSMVAALLAFSYFVGFDGTASVAAAEVVVGGQPAPAVAPPAGSSRSTFPNPSTSPTTLASTTTTTSTTTTASVPAGSPPHEVRYVVPFTEVQPQAKQLAADIAYLLVTYEETDDRVERLYGVAGLSGIELLAEASQSLTYPGFWSRGEVLYPQMGGLRNDRASVMVVTRQTVGTGANAQFSVVRTLDIRLNLGAAGWEFDSLASAGGTFDTLEDLTLAHAVASDPRIVMPDSARLDIRAGLVSPILLAVMAELADQTPYEAAVLATGHPHYVFETDRVSHHTLGRAVDIIRIGDRLVVDDRAEESMSRAITDWLYAHPDVAQVGSPWDLDVGDSGQSFTDEVHQDHIHLAVVESE